MFSSRVVCKKNIKNNQLCVFFQLAAEHHNGHYLIRHESIEKYEFRLPPYQLTITAGGLVIWTSDTE
jgi:hypothetical protein